MEFDPLESWVDSAYCANNGIPPETFELEKHQRAESARTKMAKLICFGACQVREECLQYGVEIKDKEHIYGGLHPSERKNIRAINPH